MAIYSVPISYSYLVAMIPILELMFQRYVECGHFLEMNISLYNTSLVRELVLGLPAWR